MSKGAARLFGSGLATLFGLAACMPMAEPDSADRPIILDLGDVEDYTDWYRYDRDEEFEPEEPKPFKANPLVVTALGKVRATPDIAVIFARVSAADDNESRAVDSVSNQINIVQAALADHDVEIGFTGFRSRPEYDEACQNANHAARIRQSEIQNDYWFNRRLDEAGDTETRRRPPRPRLPLRVCQAQEIYVSTNMVVRVRPADAAGDVLRALGAADVESARLYGYDFSDYDALYQDAADAAVRNARAKAELVADGAGGELGDIVAMSVSRPGRIGRFGPQPTVIRPPRPRSGDGVSALDSYGIEQERGRVPPSPPPPMAGFGGGDGEIIVTASRRVTDQSLSLSPITVADIAFASADTVGATSLQVSGNVNDVSPTGSTLGSNALTMSLMSGPQTIEVAARLSYAYPTPLDGIIIAEPEEG